MSQSIRLEDLEIYRLGLAIGDDVWKIVDEWSVFARRTVGGQFVSAADSIAANISEGYGRYFYKDRKRFCYYSRGSLMETKTWAQKAFDRKLISKDSFDQLMEKLSLLLFRLNTYIKKLKQNVESSNA